MNFFRLRFTNTLLVLFIGIILGYVMKDRTADKRGRPYIAKYPSAYTAAAGAPVPAPAAENPGPLKRTGETGGEEFDLPVKLVVTPDSEEPAAEAPREDMEDSAVRGAEEAFFKDPARFAGRDLEMDLQMIMARKTAKGWLLNLVHTKGGKNVDYLYVEDGGTADGPVVGDKPDLKIGYTYKVRFRCRKGETASGNNLLSLTPTDEKASWATGESAVE